MEICLQGLKTLRIKLVEPACADGLIHDKASLFQHLKMLRDRWSADWEFTREFTNSTGTSPEAFKNGPPSGVAQGIECLM
jgi:hypothetical protein